MSCGGTLGVTLEWRSLCGGTSGVASSVSRTLSRLKREGGISLETLQRKRDSSCIEGKISRFFSSLAANLGFLLSYDRDLRDPLLGPQESPVAMRVARGLLGFLCSRCLSRGPHLELRREPQGSSPVLTWISRFLRSFHRGVRPRLMCRHASLLSSLAGITVAGFLSSSHRDRWPSLKVHRAVKPAILF